MLTASDRSDFRAIEPPPLTDSTCPVSWR